MRLQGACFTPFVNQGGAWDKSLSTLLDHAQESVTYTRGPGSSCNAEIEVSFGPAVPVIAGEAEVCVGLTLSHETARWRWYKVYTTIESDIYTPNR